MSQQDDDRAADLDEEWDEPEDCPACEGTGEGHCGQRCDICGGTGVNPQLPRGEILDRDDFFPY